jgi:hypothetical protein
MSATYNPTLVTELDYVRFLIGDTSTPFLLQDEEIQALITELGPYTQARKYLAAADALSLLYVRWSLAGKGVVEKSVGKLRIKFGAESSAGEALNARIKELRETAARLLTPAPFAFRVLGTRRRDVLPRRG